MAERQETQELWPFGPPPRRDCPAGGAHDWRVIDLYHACDPPLPSFECSKCRYRWTRWWTRGEFAERLPRLGAAGRDYKNDYPTEPPYNG